MQFQWGLAATIVLNLLFSTLGDVSAKLWGLTDNWTWLVVGMGINLLTTLFFMSAIRLGSLASTTALVLLLTILINVSIGSIIFHERIVVVQWVGIAVGLSAVALMLWPSLDF